MNSKLNLTIFSFALYIILNISSAGAAIFHDEAVNGDLSSTDFGQIMGDTTIVGSLLMAELQLVRLMGPTKWIASYSEERIYGL